MMRRGQQVILTAFAVMALAACGGATNDTTTTIQAATTTSAGATTSTDNSTGGVSAACISGTQAMANAAAAYSGALSGQTDEEQLAGQLQAMAEAAPAEIRDEFRIYAEAMGQFLDGLAEVNFQPGVVPTQAQIEKLEELSEALEAEGVQEALEAIDAWFANNCRD
jgi:hypothetical protein